MSNILNMKRGAENADAVVPYTADGTIFLKVGYAVIAKTGSLAAMTLPAPQAGVDDGKRLTIISTTALAHTVTQATPGFNNAGAAQDVATFGAAVGNCIELVAYNGVWWTIQTRNVTLA